MNPDVQIVIRYDSVTTKYSIVAENTKNHEAFTLFRHKEWDTIKAQRDQLERLFGVAIQLAKD